MNINDFILKKNITEILHFTTVKGLTGCASQQRVLSRKALGEEQYLSYIASPVSKERKEAEKTFNKDENWLDFINLSISEINTHYFNAAQRWFHEHDAWWCIMSFDPIILTHDNVYFTTTNNIYTSVKRNKGLSGLQAMYDAQIVRWNSNVVYREGRAKHLTTCEQAEVLYPNPLSLNFLKKIYTQCPEQEASVYGTLCSLGIRSVEIETMPNKFLGIPNT
ncbi:DarT ssDNA thymidine ADP-ribosyltransferase family protein [Xenorhabdus innexi]|uniref:DarT domain-containing protein n=1 Tax=Xenorhabdus innexi TaxID=290109 RepID=A0A1N6MU68_9GAMM|nr:DarT ssDNA thymidine ADP-ribosyltransferase family protein [Xenorhabdus innexi]PHM36463.1 hypothetical protein Xinn_01602 [Xenorhabdus innexi]SIP72413.1 conserved hypothetical protein [Xenorhabdus innexi]